MKKIFYKLTEIFTLVFLGALGYSCFLAWEEDNNPGYASRVYGASLGRRKEDLV